MFPFFFSIKTNRPYEAYHTILVLLVWTFTFSAHGPADCTPCKFKCILLIVDFKTQNRISKNCVAEICAKGQDRGTKVTCRQGGIYVCANRAWLESTLTSRGGDSPPGPPLSERVTVALTSRTAPKPPK